MFAVLMLSAPFANAEPTALQSSVISTFRLHDCVGAKCVSVSAPEAEVSRTMTSISAKNVVLKIDALKMTCASFRYDLKTQFVMCDNRDVGKASITISKGLSIQHYAAL